MRRKQASSMDATEGPRSIVVHGGDGGSPLFRSIWKQLGRTWPKAAVETAPDWQSLQRNLADPNVDTLILITTGDPASDMELLQQVRPAIPPAIVVLYVMNEKQAIRIDVARSRDDEFSGSAAEDVVDLLQRRQRSAANRERQRTRFERLWQANRRHRRLALEDALTGLLNRRGFHRILKLQWAQAQRYGSELSCVAIDLDYFKRINDMHGHALGDWVLRCFAAMLTSLCRTSDVVGRVGGEEFCVLLPNSNERHSAEWAEKARRRIADSELLAKGRSIRLTASFGVASVQPSLRSEYELLDLADRALLVAKHGGRNRVVEASSILRGGGDSNHPEARNPVVRSLLDSLALRDPSLAQHCERVANHAARLARQAGLHENEVWTAEIAGLLHDIGKIGIPDNVLRKPAALSPDEGELVRRSLESSHDIVRSAFGDGPVSESVRNCRRWYKDMAECPRMERTVVGQIVAIADAFDSMTSPAPYRRPRTREDALDELARCSGTQFNSDLVRQFRVVLSVGDA